jgi:hypothetical protein
VIPFTKIIAIASTVIMPMAAGAESCGSTPQDNKPVKVACKIRGSVVMSSSTTYVVTKSFHSGAVKPGTYNSCGGSGCSWYKTKKNPKASSKVDKLVSQGGGNYRQIITLTSQDKAFTTSGCGPWFKR